MSHIWSSIWRKVLLLRVWINHGDNLPPNCTRTMVSLGTLLRPTLISFGDSSRQRNETDVSRVRRSLRRRNRRRHLSLAVEHMAPRRVLLPPTVTPNPPRRPQLHLRKCHMLDQSLLPNRLHDLHLPFPPHNAIQALLLPHLHLFLPEVLLSHHRLLLVDQLVLHLCILLGQLLHVRE